MPRGVDHLEVGARRTQRLAPVDQAQVGRLAHLDAELGDHLLHLFASRARVGQQLAIGAVQPGRDAEMVGDLGGLGDVVDVAVGEQHRVHGEAVLLDGAADRGRGGDTGVDHHDVPVRQPEQVAVGLPGAGREGREEHGSHPIGVGRKRSPRVFGQDGGHE